MREAARVATQSNVARITKRFAAASNERMLAPGAYVGVLVPPKLKKTYKIGNVAGVIISSSSNGYHRIRYESRFEKKDIH